MADAEDTATGSRAQQVGALLLLLPAGILSLPVVAYFLDGEGQENWIIPVQLAAMALLGAVVGSILPGIAGSSATRSRARVVGALVGIGMGVLAVVIFFLLLNGFDGA